MQSYEHGLSLRASSATLYRRHLLNKTADDISIARELLHGPKIPDRGSSIQNPSSGFSPDSRLANPNLAEAKRNRRANRSSNTWTTSSAGLSSDRDDVEDRTLFLHKYNQLAEKNGVRNLALDQDEKLEKPRNVSEKSNSWFSRKILRRTSSTQTIGDKIDRNVKSRRSISDLSLRSKIKKDALKDKGLHELVRLCGWSLLYLPADYAAGSLCIPTCLRATAQYLVQHAPSTRGVFRIPGSHHVVNTLYNHYCTMDIDGELVAGTVRCPTLPEHITCGVHDVGSAFKKLLSGLPGGILGSLPLFDALISIQGQFHGGPESTRTKHSRVRARLIALAIASVGSQYRRELICAVFGLLCMVGRSAETAKREDDCGRPLPTSGLMGYSSLGIVFGPLLVNDLLDNYVLRLGDPHGGLVLLPVSPPKTRKEKHRRNRSGESMLLNTRIDKVKVASGITEMLITHWREVVRHMRNLGALRMLQSSSNFALGSFRPTLLRPSASEGFNLRKPPNWDTDTSIRPVERSPSPTPEQRGFSKPLETRLGDYSRPQQSDSLTVRKQRSRQRVTSGQRLSHVGSRGGLTPTEEEEPKENVLQSEITISSPSHAARKPDHRAEAASVLKTPINSLLKASPLKVVPTNVKTPLRLSKNLLQDGSSRTRVRRKLQRDSPKALAKGTIQTSPAQRRVSKHGVHITASDPEAHHVPTQPDETTLQHVRRLIASDPVPNADIPRHGADHVSLYSSNRRGRILGKENSYFSNSTDPLAWVSVEEDMASLAVLAQVIDSLEEVMTPKEESDVKVPNGSASNVKDAFSGESRTGGSQFPITSTSELQKDPVLFSVLHTPPSAKHLQAPRTQASDVRIFKDAWESKLGNIQTILGNGLGHADQALPSPLSDRTTSADRDGLMPWGSNASRKNMASERHSTPGKAFHSALVSVSPPRFVPVQPADGNELRKSSDQAMASSKAPTVITSQHNTMPRPQPVSYTLSCRSLGSVKELAAKFNGGLSSSIPVSSPTKAVAGPHRSPSTPKDGLVAHYTMNPSPSPSKSQKSTKSSLSARSFRNVSPPNSACKLERDVPVMRPITPLWTGKTTQQEESKLSNNLALISNSVGTTSRSRSVPVESPSDQNLNELSAPANKSKKLTRPGQPLVAQQVQYPRPETQSTVTSSLDSGCSSFSTARSIASKASTLHAQVRTLQGELYAKVEEVRQLKRQLETRDNLDIMTLDEQLRLAKRDLHIWRCRAEAAEKRLETTGALKSAPRNTVAPLSRDEKNPYFCERCENHHSIQARITSTSHGLDGGMSQNRDSEGSNGTVIRDVSSAITGSEYSDWLRDTMQELEVTGSHELA